MKTIFLTLLSELRALDLVWIRRDAFAASAVSRSAALKASKPSWPPRLPAPLLPFSSFRFNPLIKPPACVRKEKRTERKRKRGSFIHTQTDRERGKRQREREREGAEREGRTSFFFYRRRQQRKKVFMSETK